MAESNMAVLGCAGSGEVDVFAFGYERNLTLLAYLYRKYYIAVILIRQSFPRAYECTVVVGIVGVVNEVAACAVANHITAQLMCVAIWSCSLDGLKIRPQFGNGERSVKDVVPIEAPVCARCECGDELAVYYSPCAKEVRRVVGERTRRYLTAAHARHQSVAVEAVLAALVVVQIPLIPRDVFLHTLLTECAVGIVAAATAHTHTCCCYHRQQQHHSKDFLHTLIFLYVSPFVVF